MEWLTLIGGALPTIKSLVDRFIPDPDKAASLNAEIKLALIAQQSEAEKQLNELLKAQLTVNAEEAKNASVWVSGWRPAVGWICALGFFYSFFFQPTGTWLVTEFGLKPLPALDMTTLLPLAFGMLGLAGLRTYEKATGVTATETAVAPKMFK